MVENLVKEDFFRKKCVFTLFAAKSKHYQYTVIKCSKLVSLFHQKTSESVTDFCQSAYSHSGVEICPSYRPYLSHIFFFLFSALDLQPDDALVLKRRADVRGKLGLKDKAIRDYKQAIELQGRAQFLAKLKKHPQNQCV